MAFIRYFGRRRTTTHLKRYATGGELGKEEFIAGEYVLSQIRTGQIPRMPRAALPVVNRFVRGVLCNPSGEKPLSARALKRAVMSVEKVKKTKRIKIRN